jgi:hypothetical protein
MARLTGNVTNDIGTLYRCRPDHISLSGFNAPSHDFQLIGHANGLGIVKATGIRARRHR